MAPSSGPSPLAEPGLPIVRIVAVALRITWAGVVRVAVGGIAAVVVSIVMAIRSAPPAVIIRAIIVRHADSEAAIPDADIEALRACGHGNTQHGRRRQSESKFSHDAFLLCFGPSEENARP